MLLRSLAVDPKKTGEWVPWGPVISRLVPALISSALIGNCAVCQETNGYWFRWMV